MSLLGELTLAFLIESVALVALWLAMGAAAGYLILAGLGSRPRTLSALRIPALAGLAGAVVGGSLSLRFGVPEALLLSIGRRDVPLVWSLAGAIVGAFLGVLVQRRNRPA